MKTIRLNEETLENIAGLLKQELDDMEGERERRDEEFTQGENTIFVEYDVTAHRQEEEGGSDDYGNYEHAGCGEQPPQRHSSDSYSAA